MESHTLQWPAGKPRTRKPEHSRFRSKFVTTRDELLREIRLLGGSRPVISSNIPVRRDGLPYAGQRQPEDKGVAVYFSLKGRPLCFACDRWDAVEDNMQAIRRTIEALRGIERWGTGDMVQQAFTGFLALPGDSPWDVLGIALGAGRQEIEAAYRRKAKVLHPDRGGSDDAMSKLNRARDEAVRTAAR
jgi:hypothetical protein